MDLPVFMQPVTVSSEFTVEVETNNGVEDMVAAPGWYASRYELWRYLLSLTDPGHGFTLSFVADSNEININTLDGFCSFLVYAGDTAGGISALGIEGGDTLSAESPFGPGAFVSSGGITFCHPVARYDHTTLVEDGYSEIAWDGMLHSIKGKTQEARELEVVLEGGNYGEDWLKWFIILDLWHKGQPITFYPADDLMGDVSDTPTVVGGEVLVKQDHTRFMGSRIIEYTHVTPIVTEQIQLVRKNFYPLSGLQNRAWVLS